MKRINRLAILAAVPPLLAGCGGFKSSGTSDQYKVYDPNRPVARATASVTSLTFFDDAESGKQATYRATLYDAKGNQFYGPDVTLDGAKVDPAKAGPATVYTKAEIDFTPGQTFNTVIQGHGATSPPMTAKMAITSPARPVGNDGKPTQQVFDQPYGAPATIQWTGGDPSQPVYVFVYGSPDGRGPRRLFPEDDPQKSPDDPENMGRPIANTGTYTIPAQVTERYVAANGQDATRTTTVFGNTLNAVAGDPTKNRNVMTIFVVQRAANLAPPVSFSSVVGADAAAAVAGKPAS